MRLIATQEGWAPGVDDRLKGRWGIPSLERLVTPKYWSKELPPMNQPPEVSGFRYQRNKSGELVFSFQARKALTKGMGLLFRAVLFDKDTRKPIMQTNAKEVLQKTVWVSNPDRRDSIAVSGESGSFAGFHGHRSTAPPLDKTTGHTGLHQAAGCAVTAFNKNDISGKNDDADKANIDRLFNDIFVRGK